MPRLGVVEDVDDGAGEGGVGQRRHGDQQAAGPDVVERADGERGDRRGATPTGRGPRGRSGLGIGRRGHRSHRCQCAPPRRGAEVGGPPPWQLGRPPATTRSGPVARLGGDRADAAGPLRVTGVPAGGDDRPPPARRAGTSAGCWAPGCSPSSATASSRPRWPARCCSTRSGRPTRRRRRRLRRPAAAVLAGRARSPASGWTGGAAGRCCCGPTCVRAGLVAVVAALVLGGVEGTGVLRGRAGRLLGQPVRPRRAVGGAAAHHRRAVPGLGQRAVDDVGRGGHRGRRRRGARPAAADRRRRRRLRRRGAGGGAALPGAPRPSSPGSPARTWAPTTSRRPPRLSAREVRRRAWSPAPGTRGRSPPAAAALLAIGAAPPLLRLS